MVKTAPRGSFFRVQSRKKLSVYLLKLHHVCAGFVTMGDKYATFFIYFPEARIKLHVYLTLQMLERKDDGVFVMVLAVFTLNN